MPGLDLALHYRPVSPALLAGGDFVDVVDLDGRRWAFAIGDVCGKGPHVAAVTGEVRHMLRALARVTPTPREALSRLNDVLWREELDADSPGERFCTACCAHVDPTTRPLEVTLCGAGHPPALVRRADGRVESVGATGQLLGVLPDVELAETTVRLDADDLLLLYTDGAIEQRGMWPAAGEHALWRAVETAPPGNARDALTHIRRAVEERGDRVDDDVALLLVRPDR